MSDLTYTDPRTGEVINDPEVPARTVGRPRRTPDHRHSRRLPRQALPHGPAQLKVSRDWQEWAKIDGRLLTQTEFAEFIADHLSTIGSPDGGQLVDICETLTGTTDARWKSQSLDKNGQRQFVYEEQVDGKAGAKGDLPIPTELILVVRPFQGSATEAIKARFRFRLRDGYLTMGVKLDEPDRVLEDAFNRIVEDLQDAAPAVRINHGRTNHGR